MSRFKSMIILSMIIGLNLSLAQIKSNCGQLTAEGYKYCTISQENRTVSYEGPEKRVIPGFWFGLITYRCDEFSSYLVSKFDCKGCDFYCSYDEYISDCHRDGIQFWVGLISGVCVTCLVGTFIFGYLYKTLSSKFPYGKLFGRRGVVEYSKKEMSAIVGGTQAIVSRKSSPLDQRKDTQGSSTSVFDKMSCNLERIDCKDQGKTFKSNEKKQVKSSTDKRTLKSIILGLLTIKLANACDTTVTMMNFHNLTMICDSKNYCSTSPYFFETIKAGQKICLQDSSGNEVSLSFSNMIYRNRYKLAYLTTDYTINDLKTASSCCGNCMDDDDYRDSCKKSVERSIGGNLANNGSSTYFCGVRSTGVSDVACIHFWEKRPVGELYQIYLAVERVWTAELILVQNNNVQERSISNRYPVLYFNGFQLDMPGNIITVQPSGSNPTNALLRVNDSYYFVNAAGKGNPNPALQGDFQVAIDNNHEVHYSSAPKSIECTIDESNGDNCSCSCHVDHNSDGKSKIKEFHEMQDRIIWAENYLLREKGDRPVIETIVKVEKNISDITLKLIPPKDFSLVTGKCDVNFVMAHGKSLAGGSSYIVLQSHNITSNGVLPLISNCSLDKNYLICDYEPTKLLMMNKDRHCFIRLPTINKTMLITVEYSDFEHRSQLKKGSCNESYFSEVQSSLSSYGRFIDTFAKTVLYCSVFGVIVTCFAGIIGSSKNQRC